jgi:hypothetical protein
VSILVALELIYYVHDYEEENHGYNDQATNCAKGLLFQGGLVLEPSRVVSVRFLIDSAYDQGNDYGRDGCKRRDSVELLQPSLIDSCGSSDCRCH